MTSPSSPSVQVTSVTPAPSAAYLAMVAPVPIDSSSGWACTSSNRRSPGRWSMQRGYRQARQAVLAVSRAMTDTFPRQQARTKKFSCGVPRSFQVSPDGARIVFLRSQGGTDPVTCLWVRDLAAAAERLVVDPAGIGGDTDE